MNSLRLRGVQSGRLLRLQIYRDVQWLQSPGGRAPGGDTKADPPKDTSAGDQEETKHAKEEVPRLQDLGESQGQELPDEGVWEGTKEQILREPPRPLTPSLPCYFTTPHLNSFKGHLTGERLGPHTPTETRSGGPKCIQES